MNINSGVRLMVACLAIATLPTLSACADTDPRMERPHFTSNDLEPLSSKEFDPPLNPQYDLQHEVGTSCRLVAYKYKLDSGEVMYEYVVYS